MKLTAVGGVILLAAFQTIALGAQSRVVTGKVLDPDGRPVQGATVTTPKKGVQTDQAGRFVFPLGEWDTVTVLVRQIGFAARAVLLRFNADTTIALVPPQTTETCPADRDSAASLAGWGPIATSPGVEEVRVWSSSCGFMVPDVGMRVIRDRRKTRAGVIFSWRKAANPDTSVQRDTTGRRRTWLDDLATAYGCGRPILRGGFGVCEVKTRPSAVRAAWEVLERENAWGLTQTPNSFGLDGFDVVFQAAGRGRPVFLVYWMPRLGRTSDEDRVVRIEAALHRILVPTPSKP